MGVVTYLGFVGVALVVEVAVARFQPAVVGQLARRAGVSGVRGWAVAVVATLWTFLPVLAGAETGDGELWVVGAAGAGIGWYLATVAVGSVGTYRLLRRAERVPPEGVRPGADAVVTAGVPEPESDDARAPFSGEPAVHVDWLVQARRRIAFREAWVGVAGDATGTAFTLGDGAVAVPAGDHRVFGGTERITTFDPDEALPDAAAALLREHPDLPAPDGRERRLRCTESYVPADGPVTVVGVPRQGEYPGQSLVAGSGEEGDGGDGAVLIRGDVDAATTRLRQRVRWAGAAGAALVLGGQLLAFLLSAASVGGLLRLL